MFTRVVVSPALHIVEHRVGGEKDHGVIIGADVAECFGDGEDFSCGCHGFVGRAVSQVVRQANEIVVIALFRGGAVFWKLREILPFRVVTQVVLRGVFQIN